MAKIVDIEGIGPANEKKLTAAGVKTTGALLKAAGAKKDRKAFAAATGIKEESILEWVNRADLFRVKGVGTQYSDLLEAAGVDSPSELSKRRADNLTKAMADANVKGKNKLVRRPPTEKMVQAMIDHAKTLSKVVTH
jgi:predicted flap endonuclease-1-like 5' DNA nuclease